MTDVAGRVLLADDERTFAYTTSRVLERHGLGCDWVGSADEAMEALMARSYDVLVADIKMPGNDRLGLFEWMREHADPPAVILITGYPSVETAVRSIELGTFAYLIKPFDMGEFIETVKRAVKTTALRRKMKTRSGTIGRLQERLESLRQELNRNGANSLDQSAAEYLNLLLLGTGETVMEAVDVLQLMGGDSKNVPLRELSSHPEMEILRNAVDETVQVLEKTKRSFKSKELALLRKRLERLLELTEEDRQGGLRDLS